MYSLAKQYGLVAPPQPAGVNRAPLSPPAPPPTGAPPSTFDGGTFTSSATSDDTSRLTLGQSRRLGLGPPIHPWHSDTAAHSPVVAGYQLDFRRLCLLLGHSRRRLPTPRSHRRQPGTIPAATAPALDLRRAPTAVNQPCDTPSLPGEMAMAQRSGRAEKASPAAAPPVTQRPPAPPVAQAQSARPGIGRDRLRHCSVRSLCAPEFTRAAHDGNPASSLGARGSGRSRHGESMPGPRDRGGDSADMAETNEARAHHQGESIFRRTTARSARLRPGHCWPMRSRM